MVFVHRCIAAGEVQGNVVGETQIGANSYEGWEAIVRELLG